MHREGGCRRRIARGPVAAVVAIKHLGTNGGGFFGANSAHPFENPSAWTNFLECVSILIFPFSLIVMFGRMLDSMRHAARHLRGHDDAVPGRVHRLGRPPPTPRSPTRRWPASTPRATRYSITVLARRAQGGSIPPRGVPGCRSISDGLGNLEGKELRFGPSAGPTWAAITTCTSNGSVNCMHDSLNPLAGLTPLAGMWLNCVFGGIGVGLINLLVYLIVGVFLAGLMVGRTPEYLGKKVEAREMKLAMLALLIHPFLILGPTGLFAAMALGPADSTSKSGRAWLQRDPLRASLSASANNGSGFERAGADTVGLPERSEKANPVKRSGPVSAFTGTSPPGWWMC